MASPKVSFISLAILLSLAGNIITYSNGEVICENLPQHLCAFAISSTSKRCTLESSYHQKDKSTVYECRTSDVTVPRMSEYIETDECIKACGVQRNTVGISSDSLLEPKFTAKLCSPHCHQHCPNIVDLFFNLAAGEGVFLPELCQAMKSNTRRSMVELSSSGVAPGPISSQSENIVGHYSEYGSASAPAPAPMSL